MIVRDGRTPRGRVESAPVPFGRYSGLPMVGVHGTGTGAGQGKHQLGSLAYLFRRRRPRHEVAAAPVTVTSRVVVLRCPGCDVEFKAPFVRRLARRRRWCTESCKQRTYAREHRPAPVGRKGPIPRVNECGHTERRHRARGMCGSCYELRRSH